MVYGASIPADTGAGRSADSISIIVVLVIATRSRLVNRALDDATTRYELSNTRFPTAATFAPDRHSRNVSEDVDVSIAV